MESISLGEFRKLRDSGINILDSRPTSLFSKKHIPDSIGISINGSFEYMINCFFPEKSKLILISKRDRLSESLLRLESEGYLDIVKIPRVEASKASKYVDNLIDVSNREDWEVLHVKGVSNVPLVDLIKSPNLISADSVLYCGNGHKSMAAVSFLLT